MARYKELFDSLNITDWRGAVAVQYYNTGLRPHFTRSSQQGGLKRALDRSSRVGGVDSSIL